MRFYLLYIFLIFCSLANGQDALNSFKNANKLYENAAYQEAINEYKAILAQGYISDDLHYNLGNAYFKSNQVAAAILHYEKALKINPSNQDANFNLKLANQKTIDKIEAIPELFIYRWWKAIYNLFSLDQWAYICLFMFLVFAGGLSLYFISKVLTLRKVAFYTSLIALFFALCSWLLAAQQKRAMETADSGIIMQASVNIISAPSEASSQLFVLHEGSKVHIKERSENWLRITLPNGNEGWVQESALAEI